MQSKSSKSYESSLLSRASRVYVRKCNEARRQFCFNHAALRCDSSAGWKGKRIWRNRGERGRTRELPSVISSRAEFILVTETLRQTVSRSNVSIRGCKWKEWLQSPTSFRISTGLIVERAWRGAVGDFSLLSPSLSSSPVISDYFQNQPGFDSFFPSTRSLLNEAGINPLLLSTWDFKPRNLCAQSPHCRFFLSLSSKPASSVLQR